MTDFRITEMFCSLQGEARWAGTPFFFVRLAHCNVGGSKGICKTWSGKEFVCDTGPAANQKGSVEWYSYTTIQHRLTVEELWSKFVDSGYNHICFTGGEPFVQHKPLLTFIQKFYSYCNNDQMLHIESSGTLLPKENVDQYAHYFLHSCIWLTVSPKFKYMNALSDYAKELKLLIDTSTSAEELNKLWIERYKESFFNGSKVLYLQPIDCGNDTIENKIQSRKNVEHTIKLCQQFPRYCHLSLQTHKYLEIR